MASRSEQRAQDQATQQRRDAACADLIAHADVPNAIGFDNARGVAVGVLSALIEAIAGDITDARELRRKGWQGRVTGLESARTALSDWRDLLVAYTLPTPLEAPPAREPVQLPTEHGVGVEPRPATVDDLDARLAEAFGPELVPTRHIRTVIEGGPTADGGDDRSYGALCGSTTGSWTHPGGANCEDCHARYAEDNGGEPYAGPTAHGNTVPGLEMIDAAALVTSSPHLLDADREQGPTLAESTPLQDLTAALKRRDEPVTPAVAREIREEVERDAPPMTMPTFVDPPARPAQRERLSLLQVREHAMRRARGSEHRSVSQVEGFADCGTRYALSDLERPAWWNIGGKALHRAIETINRYAADDARAAEVTADHEALFLRSLDAEIADQHAATPQFPMDTWRAGKKGSEHYDFWRVEGPVMVQRWVAWLSRMLADGWTIARAPSDEHPRDVFWPVVEYETRLNVGLEVPNLSIIDLALYHPPRDVLLIVDIKAGASAPKSTFQLGVYGWALLGAGIAGFTPAPDLSNVRGVYWRARTGEAHPPIDDSNGWPILQMHPWADVVQRFRDMDTMERHGVYQPNVTTFCGGCGVRDLCPAQATAPSA